MDRDLALLVAGIIFGIVALFHLIRLGFKFEMSVGGHKIPLCLNLFGLLLAGGMCIWMLMVR